MDWIVIGLFVFFCYDLVKLINKAMERKKKLRQAQLKDIPTQIDLPNKLNFLNKRISINEKSIDVFSKNKVILHLSKVKKQIELRKSMGNKILKFNDIHFVFLEYNQYEKDTLIDSFSSGSSYDKNVWNNSIMAMLKNGQQVKLFEAKLEETNYEQLVDYQISGKYEEKSYLENGKKIVRLFSHYTNKKYLIVNNTV
ncbi:hypothetical protein [Flagellimonas eckloniae]|uniref:Uncharacterized protein n=1 Tax=Flagellimonas eckloniae TaxID=346185 RepID=A0A0Q0XQQ3_9FLAO|nr:hypothetical protein [Allomuricauda eckloniae]KQC31497.1 hypothetical protein AAY42_17675 [Allomuricauda eckloniae]